MLRARFFTEMMAAMKVIPTNLAPHWAAMSAILKLRALSKVDLSVLQKQKVLSVALNWAIRRDDPMAVTRPKD